MPEPIARERVLAAPRAWSPWSPADGVRWLGIAVIGHLTCLAAWWLVHREASFDHQVRWLVLGVAGFIVAVYADLSWLLRARWRVLQRRLVLLPDDIAAPDAATTTLVVAGPGLAMFHRPDCVLATGKRWPLIPRADVADRRPCGVCQP